MKKIKASPYHQLFWIEYQLDPQRIDYNIVIDQLLKGNLDVQRLKISLNKFVADHFLLNSHLATNIEGELYWEINDNIAELEIYDSVEQKKKFIQQFFNLENGPLYHFGLFKESDQHYNLVLKLHHIVVDGFSGDEFISLISDYYNLKNSGEISIEIQEKKIDNLFIRLHKKVDFLLENQSLSFWKKVLQGAPARNELAYFKDSKRPLENTQIVSELRFVLEKNIIEFLEKHTQQFSWFNKFILVWGVLIARYTGNNTAHIGYPVGIRQGARFIYGAHINTLVLPVCIQEKSNFLSLLTEQESLQLRMRINEDCKHSDLPTEYIIQCAGVQDLNVRFAQTNLNDKCFEFSELQVQINRFSNVDISGSELLLEYQKEGDHYNFRLRYRTDLFPESWIKQIEKHYIHLLFRLLQHPNKPINTLHLLTHKEYQQIVLYWNRTDKAYPDDKTVYQLFEEQVKKTPHNIAVIFEHQQLTYHELNERSNQLARYIRDVYQQIQSTPLEPDVLVALCLDRSLEMIIGILGVMKAGAAYVPIDPEYPAERIQYLFEDTQTVLVLTQRHRVESLERNLQVERLPEKLKFIVLDSDCYRKEIKSNLSPQNKASDLAYVIYTSGTTGQPKGVLTNHKSLVNRLVWMQQTYGFQTRDKVLQKTPYVFDVSVWELLLPGICGAQLVFARVDGHKDPVYLTNLIAENGITQLHFVPSMLQVFLYSCDNLSIRCKFKSVRDIFCSGEALPAQLAAKFKENFKFIRLHNLYGPTEVAIDISAYSDIQENEVIIPIGKPIQNVCIYILNKAMQPVPIGVVGELYVRGADIFKGYFKKENLTQERFVPNLFANERDSELGRNRLYKTGDLVKWLPNGNIEYIGRNDFQVKIHGYRIELGEIENALSNYPCITEVVVLIKKREDAEASNYLVAYYVSSKTIIEAHLIEHLSQSLPKYMIPVVFVYMDSFPLTINGKLDRKYLPSPRFYHEDNYVAPASDLEIKLCEIWKDILNLEKIGVNDDFFSVGGDSILSVKAVEKIKRIGVYISLKDLFHHSTVYKLSRYIFESNDKKQKDVAPPEYKTYDALLEEKKLEAVYPATEMQKLMISEFQKLNSSVYFFQTCYTINSATINENFISKICDIVNAASIFRTYFIKKNKNHDILQAVRKEINFTIDKVYFKHDSDIDNYFSEDRRRSFYPFDSDEVLIRIKIFEIKEKKHIYVFLCIMQ